ncbi:hypothetical protein [Roseicella aerolata]|uniref:Uncharacterized protein n=1 Tax=Roseicella aerolata TaxID=2883479 RepID=A0A9X1ID75_9PROT|nr:hypothetical protein [Roseicella aerolata]MCB4821158.1 hypothetical protein [Roseicella aerolata]
MTEWQVLLIGAAKPGWIRIAMATALALGTLGTIGWLSINETPAAQRAAEKIRPYDPLQ